jgi:hypothetical protein
MTVLPGTAIAVDGPQYGIWLYDLANLQFQGTATQPINLFHYNAVQEQSNTNWAPTTWVGFLYNESGGPSTANFRFVNWSGIAGEKFLDTGPALPALPMFGCQLYNGNFYVAGPNLLATNCLFQRVALTLDDESWYEPNNEFLYNNLLEAGSFTTYHDEGDLGGTWTLCDNFFDQTTISQDGPMDVTANNGFDTNCDRLSPTNAYDVVLTNSPAYETGTLGVYYYPTNLPLIGAGSRSAAAAGLYHFTVTTNNVVEGTNQVSIGYHYVATDTNGVPLDTNGDGIPDYLEDWNGNGLVDSGEIAWNVAGDLGLTVVITQPANNSKMP